MMDSDDRATTLPVYVLIGGNSRRFATDKAAYLVDDQPWASHVGRRLSCPNEAFMLVGPTAPRGVLADLPFVADQEGVTGPAAGVLAALRDRQQRMGPGLLVLASCDLVRPQRAWLDPLLEAHEADPQLHVAAYQSANRWQPFPSVLHTQWLTELTISLTTGAVAMQELFDASKAISIPWHGDPAGPPQANTPEELADILG